MEWNCKIISVIEGTRKHAIAMHSKFVTIYFAKPFCFIIKKCKHKGIPYYNISVGFIKINFGYKQEWVLVENND